MPAIPSSKQAASKTQGKRADFFGAVARTYANHYSRTGTPSAYFFRRRQALVMNFLRGASGVILDVGCGPAVYAKACLDRGFCYRGVDASPGMVEEGRRTIGDLQGADLALGDARKLPYPPDSFDAVLCLGMLEYLSKEDEAICLRELMRVLKPGGVIVFSFLNAASPYWLWIEHCYPPLKFAFKNVVALLGMSKWIRLRESKGSPPTRRFRRAERLKTLRRHQLSIERDTYFSLNIFPRPLDRMIGAPCAWVSAVLEPLLSVPLMGWLGMAFVVLARKPALDTAQADSPPAHLED